MTVSSSLTGGVAAVRGVLCWPAPSSLCKTPRTNTTDRLGTSSTFTDGFSRKVSAQVFVLKTSC